MPIPILEPSSGETAQRIRRKVLAVEGIEDCDVHVGSPGKKPHVSLRVFLEGRPGYERIHEISSRVDHEVRKVVPNARVLIRSVTKAGGKGAYEGVWDLVRRIADQEPGSRGAHSVHLQDLEGKLGVDFHLEVSARLNVKQAHDVSTSMEKKIRAADPRISEVIIHEETTSERVASERSGHGSDLVWYLHHVMRRFPEVRLASPPVIRRLVEKQLHVIIRTSFSPGLSMDKAGQVTSKLEAAIKDGYRGIVRVDIIHEPSDGRPGPRPAGQPPW